MGILTDSVLVRTRSCVLTIAEFSLRIQHSLLDGFTDPFLEDFYPAGEQSRDFKPMYFDSELEQKRASLIMQPALFSMYWMVYEKERRLKMTRALPDTVVEMHFSDFVPRVGRAQSIRFTASDKRCCGNRRVRIRPKSRLEALHETDEADDSAIESHAVS